VLWHCLLGHTKATWSVKTVPISVKVFFRNSDEEIEGGNCLTQIDRKMPIDVVCVCVCMCKTVY